MKTIAAKEAPADPKRLNSDQLKLLAEYPECPQWIIAKPYDEAVRLMEMRRRAFPLTNG